MPEFLDQDEIDKLMGVGISDSVPSDSEQFSNEPVKLHLGAQQKIIRGKIPALDIVNDIFARNYQRHLSVYLNSTVSVTPSDVKSMKMQEYLSDLLQPTSLNIVKLSPFDAGSIMVVMEAPLVYASLNLHYGGSPDYHYKIEGKDFHGIEKDFVNNMLLAVFKEYTEAWAPIQNVSMEVVYSDTNPRYETGISPNETVYVSKMDVQFDGGGGSVHFCIPFSVISPFLDDLEERVKAFQGGVGASWKSVLASEMVETRVEVDCLLGQVDILFKELQSAEVGDFIPFKMFDKSVLLANDQPVFIGDHCISANGLKSLKVTAALKHPGSKR